jgi:hypothetical protein
MTSVAHEIYELLELDPTRANADVLAKERLKELDVACISCSRCSGSGKYTKSSFSEGLCFKCNGRGATGLRLTKLALDQLRALHIEGTLIKRQARWSGHEFVRKARFQLLTFVENIGIATQYGYVVKDAPVGDWDFDVREIHHRMSVVINRFSKLVDAVTFCTMSDDAQQEQLPLYRESYKAALDHLTKLKSEFQSYTAWHIKPDYRKRCVAMIRQHNNHR